MQVLVHIFDESGIHYCEVVRKKIQNIPKIKTLIRFLEVKKHKFYKLYHINYIYIYNTLFYYTNIFKQIMAAFKKISNSFSVAGILSTDALTAAKEQFNSILYLTTDVGADEG